MVSSDQAFATFWFLYVAIELGLLALVIRANFGSQQNRALALLLAIDAYWVASIGASLVAAPPWNGVFERVGWYVVFIWGFAAANFLLVFPRQRLSSRGLWLTRAGFLAAAVASFVAFVANAGLRGNPGEPYQALEHVGAISVGVLPVLFALVLLRDYLKAPAATGASAFLLLSLALFVWDLEQVVRALPTLSTSRPDQFVYTWLIAALAAALLVLAVYSSVRARPGSAARANLRRYVGTLLVFIALFALAWSVDKGNSDALLTRSAIILANLTMPLLFSFALLRYQLLGIELKVRWSISHGTVAAAFIAAALIGSQLAENFLNTRYNWVIGSLTAGLLAFAVKPLQQLADRVANSALPGMKAASDMKQNERLAVYEQNVRIAWADGRLGKKERQLLRNMREYLGVTANQAEHIESKVTAN